MSVEFNPRHPNANIHGMIGSSGEATCQTGNGVLCTGCCTALRMDDKEPINEEGSNCFAQIPEQGCIFVINGTPGERYKNCTPYHCSADINRARGGSVPARQRIALEATSALLNGEISQTQYRECLDRFDKLV